MRKQKDIKIGNYTLEEILIRHKHWINQDCENWKDMCADLSYADLSYANMSYADLSYADLRCANMSYANISGANMCDTDRLRKGIKLSEPIIGWKKCKNNVLVKLEIPRGAIVFSINNNECRTDKAKVLEIIGGDRAYSNHKFFSYYVGDIIEVFNFNCEYNVDCAEGIHFFRIQRDTEIN